jgi:hypothetical protein
MKRRQSVLLIAALVAALVALAACSKTATNSNNANTNTTTNTSNRMAASNTATVNSSTSNPAMTADSSPTDVFRAVYDSFRNKDAASFKKMLASSDIKDIDEAAKKKNKTVDDFLKELVESPEAAPPATLETRNEKIDGDKATLETKGKTGNWNTIHFVKEGGAWKVKLSGDSDGDDNSKTESMDGHESSGGVK